jgi:hypothetical protein
LRDGKIDQAEQRPASANGKWFIVRDARPHANHPAAETKPDLGTASAGPGLPPAASSRVPPRATTWSSSVPSPPFRATVPGEADIFVRGALAAQGFIGFVPFKHVDLDLVPSLPGVYVVLRENDTRPVFLEASPAGWFSAQHGKRPIGNRTSGRRS